MVTMAYSLLWVMQDLYHQRYPRESVSGRLYRLKNFGLRTLGFRVVYIGAL